MKTLLASLSLLFVSPLFAEETATPQSLHAFSVEDIEGNPVDFAQYKDKVVLVVNTASKCGHTRQYADLVQLQKDYEEKGVVVLGFPANNFANQEPGSNEQILAFCETRFNVNFPLFSKVSVRGEDQHPLFAFLTEAENPDFTGNINWNFEKILVGPDGTVQRRFRSRTNPSGPEIREAIDALVARD